jgi:TetR/AcrR family transcriptional repressor of nem operon
MGRTSDADIRLMDAALGLIWEKSYGAVTIDDICNRANVKKGSFYYFFKSKAELAVAALERMWAEESKPKMDVIFSQSKDPLTRFKDYFEMVYQKQLEVKKEHGRVLGCPVCSLGSEISAREVEDVNAKVREIFTRKRRYYESTIRDAIAEGLIEPCEPAEKAVAITGLIEGIVSQAKILNDPEIARSLPEMGLALLAPKRPVAVAPAG